MKRFISIISALLINILIIPAYCSADCRGCCTGHGGVKCEDGITKCVDGTPLSDACKNKGCQICDVQVQEGSGDVIKIASFNIQAFGRTKASKLEVMEILSETISHFDIVAIQEIRDKTGTAIKDLQEKVDDLESDYDLITGERLGRTNSKEQYAYLYKSSTILLEDDYTFKETGKDVFHREPFIAKFKVKNGNFDFILITIHTDPDDATSEINSLPLAVADATAHFQNEPDIIILGDFNADCSYFDENDSKCPLRDIEKYRWLITNEMDTNVSSNRDCTYDRMVITTSLNEDYAGTSQVFRFDKEFELDCEPEAVSDHYPVYSEFYINNDKD